MAIPRVFISSTYKDLRHVRQQVKSFFDNVGYETVLFEEGDVPYPSSTRVEESAIRETDSCDLVIAVIGARFGTGMVEGGWSVTHEEIMRSVKSKKQTYIFIDIAVFSEYETWSLNQGNESVIYRVDDTRIFEFIKDVYSYRNVAIIPYAKSEEIVVMLRKQLAGLFQQYLRDTSEGLTSSNVKRLEDTIDRLEGLVRILIDRSEIKEDAVGQIVLLNHPVFADIQQVLGTSMRVFFTNVDEMTNLFRAFGYTRDELDLVFGSQYEYDKRDTLRSSQGAEVQITTIAVARDLFDSDYKLIPLLPGDYDQKSVTKRQMSHEEPDDDLPF